jgi:hypothetical protein
MERGNIKSYTTLYERVGPSPICSQEHLQLSRRLRIYWLRAIFTKDIHSAEAVYCLALLIMVKHRTSKEASNREYTSSDVKACLLIAARLLIHTQEYVTVKVSPRIEDAASNVLMTLNAELYIPTAITFFDCLNTIYNMIPDEYVALTRQAISFAYASNISAVLTPLQLAMAATQYIYSIYADLDIRILDDYAVTADGIDTFHHSLMTSPLSCAELPQYFVDRTLKYVPGANNISLIKRITTHLAKAVIAKKALPMANGGVSPKTSRGKTLGRSLSGEVCKAIQPSGKIVAQKTQYDPDNFTKEVVLMQTLRHKNIQNITGFSPSKLLIEMVVQPNSLQDHIETGIDLVTRRRYAKQLFQGLVHIHDHGVLHGDLKPPNILVTRAGVLKLADFGSSLSFRNRARYGPYSTQQVTSWYRPYELFIDGEVRYSLEIDVWSAGVIILVLNGKIPTWFGPDSDIKERMEDQLSKLSLLVAGLDADIILLILQCLNKDPITRITAAQVLCILE